MATRWPCVPPHCYSTVKFTHSGKGNHSRNAQTAKRKSRHRNFLLWNVHQDLSSYGDRAVLVLLGGCPLINVRRMEEEKMTCGAGEMAQGPRVLAVLSEKPNSVPGTQIRYRNSRPMACSALFWPPRHCMHVYTSTHSGTHT